MTTLHDRIRQDYQHRGVIWTPPNSRTLIVKPAHPSNFSEASSGAYRLPPDRKVMNLASCVHTPEEEADDREVTPRLFAQEGYGASTHAYTDDDGDLYAMVPFDAIPWAQGTSFGGPHPTDRFVVEGTTPPDWFPRDGKGVRFNNNTFMRSNEVEGRAATMEQSFTGPQRDTLESWIGWNMWVGGYTDLDRIQAHGWLATDRSDPGAYVIGLFPKLHEAALVYVQDFEAQARDLERPHPADVPPPTEDAVAALEAKLENAEAALSARVDRIEGWIAAAPKVKVG